MTDSVKILKNVKTKFDKKKSDFIEFVCIKKNRLF
jgi:hypothetical protein